MSTEFPMIDRVAAVVAALPHDPGHSVLVIVVGPAGDFQVRATGSAEGRLDINQTVGVLTRAAAAYAAASNLSAAAFEAPRASTLTEDPQGAGESHQTSG
jgi:hypothetical protein